MEYGRCYFGTQMMSVFGIFTRFSLKERENLQIKES